MTLTQEQHELIEQTLAERQSFYNMLAAFYNAPLTIEQIDGLAGLDYSALVVGQELIDEGFDDIRRYLRKRNTGTRQALASDYTASFAGVRTYGEKVAIPCASLFCGADQRFYGTQSVEVSRIFREEGVALKSDVHLPDDHLAYMLEFLGIQSDYAKQAVERGNEEEALRILNVSKSFIEKQILPWFDNFAEIAVLLTETRFYHGVLKLTKGYLQMDCTTIDDIISEIEPKE